MHVHCDQIGVDAFQLLLPNCRHANFKSMRDAHFYGVHKTFSLRIC